MAINKMPSGKFLDCNWYITPDGDLCQIVGERDDMFEIQHHDQKTTVYVPKEKFVLEYKEWG
jgi:hypothetical protein